MPKLKAKEKIKVTCKHCNTVISQSGIRDVSVRYINEKPMFWGGIEYHTLILVKVTCSNPKCKKQYTHKEKGSQWYYK